MSNFAPVQSPARATGSPARSVDHTPQPEGQASHPIAVAEQRAADRWQPRADLPYQGLVDADLNGGGVHRVFDVDQGPGTLDVLTGDPLSTVIVDSPMVPGLGIIPRGGPDVSPTVHNSSFTKMVNGLRSRFDVVIIDGPALLASGDAEVISRHVDKTVVVVEADTSIRDDLVTAVDLVHMGGGLISGVALVETSRSVGKLARSDGPAGLLGGGRGIDRVNGRDSAAARPRSALRGPAARTPTRHVAQAARMIGTPDHRTASRPGTGSGDETAVR